MIRCFFCVLVWAVSALAGEQTAPVKPQASAVPPVSAKPRASATGTPPNIVLITLDTTRADRMGFQGSTRGLTPNLDAFARESAVFTHAYAQVPLTPPSHATILTGTYPQYHNLSEFKLELARDLPYAPDILRAHGYHTAAFIGSIMLQALAPYAPGFDRGFDVYDADYHVEGPGTDRYSTVQHRGSVVVAHALAWLDKQPKRPFFVWVHLYDAHDPYDPPEPYKSRYASQPYDGGIAYEDAVVGKFFRQLKARGLYKNTVIAVTADHGESLGAHGEDTHGIFLYDETIHVPLVIKMPRSATSAPAAQAGANARSTIPTKGAGRTQSQTPQTGHKPVDERVELVDVLPTLLEAAGIAAPPAVQGQSLLGLMRANSTGDAVDRFWRDRAAYAESEYPHLEFGWAALRSLRTQKYLYIQAPHRELYDQISDPTAQNNLAATSSAVADTLAGQLAAFREKTATQREAPKPSFDPTAQEKLGALGYVASSEGVSGPDSPGKETDPKDGIEIVNAIHRAELLHQSMQTDAAIAILKQVIAKEPSFNPYMAKLGDWLREKGDFQEALLYLRKARDMKPESVEDRFLLSKALMAARDFKAAIPELEFVVAKVPNMLDAHSYLQLAYLQADQLSDAIRECHTVLGYVGEDYGSYLILGKASALSGDTQAGVTALKKAASLEPRDPTPHLWLAEVYDQSGQKTEAAAERATARRLGAVPR